MIRRALININRSKSIHRLSLRSFSDAESKVEAAKQNVSQSPVHKLFDNSSAAEAELDRVLESQGNKKLYFASQAFTVRTMLTVGVVNIVYWATQAVQYFMYKDVVVSGIDLSVHPMWAAFGVTMTGLVVYFTRTYAHSAVVQAYETADGKRIGVQTHTVLGFPGKKIEFPIGNAKLFESKEAYMDPNYESPTKKNNQVLSMMFSSNQIPVRLNGYKSNLLLDKKGSFYHNYRLLSLLTPLEANEVARSVEKAERMNWRKNNDNPRKNKTSDN